MLGRTLSANKGAAQSSRRAGLLKKGGHALLETAGLIQPAASTGGQTSPPPLTQLVRRGTNTTRQSGCHDSRVIESSAECHVWGMGRQLVYKVT